MQYLHLFLVLENELPYTDDDDDEDDQEEGKKFDFDSDEVPEADQEPTSEHGPVFIRAQEQGPPLDFTPDHVAIEALPDNNGYYEITENNMFANRHTHDSAENPEAKTQGICSSKNNLHFLTLTAIPKCVALACVGF